MSAEKMKRVGERERGGGGKGTPRRHMPHPQRRVLYVYVDDAPVLCFPQKKSYGRDANQIDATWYVRAADDEDRFLSRRSLFLPKTNRKTLSHVDLIGY